MAALFYLLGIFCYIKARLNHFPHYRGLLFAASITCYLLAIGSKENAAILPLALILVETAFFRKTDYPPGNRRTFWLAAGGAVFVFLTGALFFLKGDVFSFLNGYGARPFTILERLLTAPRILVFYLSLLFFPLPHRLSIAHDVPYSATLIQPLSTLFSILLVILLIGVAVYRLKKWPVLSFAILFFFLNHLIESTVIPLELVFEHRNYLPSMFLFFPVAVGLTKLYDFADKQSAVAKAGLAGVIILTIFAAGLFTYLRNTSWESEKTLWEDALEKAPGIARPYLVLAGEYEKNAQFDKALDYYKISLSLPDQRPGQARGSAYNNIGTIYFARHDYAEAQKYYQEALKVRPGHARYLHNLTLTLVKSRKWAEASQKADLLIAKDITNASYYNLKGYILLKQNRPPDAIDYLTRAFNLAPFDRNSAVNLSLALSHTQKSRRAEQILRRINRNKPGDIIILMSLFENSLRAKDGPGRDRWADQLLAFFSAGEIRDFFAALDEGEIDVPISTELLAPAIAASLKEHLTGRKK
jgi:Tfp pilus assembly protein PilF